MHLHNAEQGSIDRNTPGLVLTVAAGEFFAPEHEDAGEVAARKLIADAVAEVDRSALRGVLRLAKELTTHTAAAGAAVAELAAVKDERQRLPHRLFGAALDESLSVLDERMERLTQTRDDAEAEIDRLGRELKKVHKRAAEQRAEKLTATLTARRVELASDRDALAAKIGAALAPLLAEWVRVDAELATVRAELARPATPPAEEEAEDGATLEQLRYRFHDERDDHRGEPVHAVVVRRPTGPSP